MSRRHLVVVPAPGAASAAETHGLKKMIQTSPWGRNPEGIVNSSLLSYQSTKGLATDKLDLCAICEHGCRYCSTNNGLLWTFKKQSFGDAIEQKLGKRVSPTDDPYLHIVYDGVVEQLERELSGHRPTFGKGKVLVVSQLTDAFGPYLVGQGVTRKALDLVLRFTQYTIRILTKSAVVGHPEWVEYFRQHHDRFVVGLSIGSLDDDWARRIEIGTSLPSARIRALHVLQDAGVRTFGMACPVFPDAARHLHDLLDAIRPERCETVWIEPLNDRDNWEVVRDGYPVGSPSYQWFTDTFGRRNAESWSQYASYLWVQTQLRAQSEGWLEKLRFMLYEGNHKFGITKTHKRAFCDMRGLLLQGVSDKTHRSTNPHIEEMRRLIRDVTAYDRLVSPYSAITEDDDDVGGAGIDVKHGENVT